MFLHLFNLSICYLFIILIQTILSDPNCIYNIENGLTLDIRTLGFSNGKGPKYDRITDMYPTTTTFSWNGCFSYSKSDRGNCTNAAACYTNSITNMSVVIAKQDSVQFKHNQGSSILSYQTLDVHLTVFLICRDEDEDTIIGHQDDATTYTFHIQSRCCCPGMCYYSSHSISPVVILIIILIIFLLGYIVGGVIFLKYNHKCKNQNFNIDYQQI